MNKVVYDIESYPNVFTMSVCFENGKGMRTFEISDRKNELEDMLEFLRNVKNKGFKMVGFNNAEYDYTVLHHILDGSRNARMKGGVFTISPSEIYEVSQNHFNSNAQFKGVREADHFIPQIDLFKIHHFDNRARMTSLKILEVRMLSDNIEDLPYPIGKHLTDDEIDVLIKYNQHDVRETLKFLNHSKDAVEFRDKLSDVYGFDCTNFNDTKIGKQYFINQLEKTLPGSCYAMNGRRREIRQTKRDRIDVGSILFNYLEYGREEFKLLFEWFKGRVITGTKGVFSDIPEHELGELAKYTLLKTKRKKLSNPDDTKDKWYVPPESLIEELRTENPCGWLEEKEVKSPKGAKSYYWNYRIAETLNVVVDGVVYYYGTGGIHGCVPPQVIRSDDEYSIIDADV